MFPFFCLLFIFISPWPVRAQTFEDQRRCASALAGTLVPASPPLVDAILWKGPKSMGSDFFFNEESFNALTALLETSGSAGDLELWKKMSGAGFDAWVTVKSEDGSNILAQGRILTKGYQFTLVNKKPVVTKFTLFTGDQPIQVPISAISKRSQISVSRKPFELSAGLSAIGSNAEFSRRVGISNLKRFSTAKSLAEIIRLGRLDPIPESERPDTLWNKVVYTSLHSPNGEPLFKGLNEPVLLVFDADLLNRPDCWMNPDWDVGQFTRSSLYAGHPNFRKALFLYSKYGLWGFGPEVVFAESVPLSSIRKIYVPTGAKGEIVEYLKANLTNGLPADLETLIEEKQ